MKAIVVHEYGGPEVLKYKNIQTPLQAQVKSSCGLQQPV